MNRRKREKINFHMSNSHHQKLHLLVYLLTVGFIFIMYLITVTFFDGTFMVIVFGLASFAIGIAMLFKREDIVRYISERQLNRKVEFRKKENKENLSRTLRNITPSKKRITLRVGGKATILDRLENLKKIFSKKKTKKNSEEYIEYKE